MAKKGTSHDVKTTSQVSEGTSNEVKEIVDALKQVTAALTRAGSGLEQLVQSATAGAPPPAEAAAVAINTWDDPFSEASPTPNPPLGALHQVNFIANTNTRLRTNIVDPRLPAQLYPANTPGFRYWVAAEALDSGITFWSGLMPAGTTWSTSNPMRVILVDATPDLNAYRRSSGLHFYKRDVANRTVYSGESPDVVRHELGHAVLDALRPQFFNVADAEAAAFHESFADMSAILCALQDETTRRTVITETQGRLNVNSRLSRLAEQLGWGIRQISPTAVDRDSLRNAANRFFYRRIDALPPSAPANLLSSQPHSFSRIFTGAFLDVLARMYSAPGRTPDSATLLAVSRDLGHILVDAVLAAPITTGYFSQVAAAMIQADQARFGGQNRSALTSSFIERGILSINSAVTMANAPVPAPIALAAPMDGAFAMAPNAGTQTVYSYDQEDVDGGFRMGYGETPELPSKPVSVGGALTIEVHAPVEQQRFEVASAMAGSQDDSTLDADTAIRLFVEGLIQRREVDLGSAWEVGVTGTKVSGGATHTLLTQGGKQVLKRNHFECGFCKPVAFTCA